MTHNDPDHRPEHVFGRTVTLQAGAGRESYLLLPIIPGKVKAWRSGGESRCGAAT
jgi:hypothetical protein